MEMEIILTFLGIIGMYMLYLIMNYSYYLRYLNNKKKYGKRKKTKTKCLKYDENDHGC